MWTLDAAAAEEIQGQVGGIPRGMYIKLQLAQQNRNAADAVRLERKQLDEQKQKGLDEQAARIERLRAKREQRHTEAAEQHRKRTGPATNRETSHARTRVVLLRLHQLRHCSRVPAGWFADIAEVSNGVREQVKQAEAQRKELLEAHWKEARVRVEIANNLDAKLDAKEAAQDQREREEAAVARAKLATLAAAAKAKEEVSSSLFTP